MTTFTPATLIAAAITRVAFPNKGYAPYFGSALRGLLRREMPQEMIEALGKNATMAVTRHGVLYYCPAYVQAKSVEELAFDLMHEVQHVLLAHFERTDKLAPPPEHMMLCNLAQDMSINEGLREIPALSKLGQDAVYPETFQQPGKLIWEERYRLLLKDKKSGGGKGVARGVCGGCTGVPVKGEPKEDGGRSKAQMDRMRRETAEAIKAHKAKGMGSIPSDLVVWADQMLTPPKVDWRDKLGTIIRGAITGRPGALLSTYLRPSRRQGGMGYGAGVPVLPGMCSPQVRVACIIDTSGSMTGGPLAAAASELNGILAAADADVTVCTVDAAVHGLRDVQSIDQALTMLKGGGGTSMAPGFEALTQRQPICEIAICLTDAYIPHPGDEPPFRVIWCVVRDNPDDEYQAPWGDVVMVDIKSEETPRRVA